MFKPGDRVKIIANPDEDFDPLIGRYATVIRQEGDAVDIFIDGDKLPSYFIFNELELIGEN